MIILIIAIITLMIYRDTEFLLSPNPMSDILQAAEWSSETTVPIRGNAIHACALHTGATTLTCVSEWRLVCRMYSTRVR